jgi:hypothetical protein
LLAVELALNTQGAEGIPPFEKGGVGGISTPVGQAIPAKSPSVPL